MNHEDRCPHVHSTVAEDALRDALTVETSRPWVKQRQWNPRDEEFFEVVDATDGVPLFGPPTVGPSPHHAIRYLRDVEAKADAVVALGNGIDSVLGALDALRAERRAAARLTGAADDCPDLPAALRRALDARLAQGRTEGRDECVKILSDAVARVKAMAATAMATPGMSAAVAASIEAVEQSLALLRRVGTERAESSRVLLVG